MILDVGPVTVAALIRHLSDWHTVAWNGPLGAFETPPFDAATTAFAKAVAEATGKGALRSVAGGGDTGSALRRAGVLDRMSYISTAGGAFLEWLEGKTRPVSPRSADRLRAYLAGPDIFWSEARGTDRAQKGNLCAAWTTGFRADPSPTNCPTGRRSPSGGASHYATRRHPVLRSDARQSDAVSWTEC